MNIRALKAHVERPDVLRLLLADYNGPYSIGIGLDPQQLNSREPVVIVRVSDKGRIHPPAHIQVAGEDVPVVVQGGYDAPRPLNQLN